MVLVADRNVRNHLWLFFPYPSPEPASQTGGIAKDPLLFQNHVPRKGLFSRGTCVSHTVRARSGSEWIE